MWIEGWSVDGFGHLRGAEMSGLSEGVNVILGPNESGKTTLLHFLRWVLFGFPHGGTSEVKLYRPDTGDFGGRVTVSGHTVGPGATGTDAHTLIVERHFGEDTPTLTAPDGSPVSPMLWADLVGTAGRELFETVFAITTDELSGFGSLDTDEVREHIYAAGIVGRGRSARGVLEELDTRRRKLLSAKKGRIRELHRELTAHTEQLEHAIGEARNLPTRRAEVERLARAVQDIQADRLRRASEHYRATRLVKTWPAWVEAAEARSELDALPERVALPAEPIAALDTAIAARDEADRHHAELETARRGIQEEIARTPIDDVLAQLAAEAHHLERLTQVAQQRQERIRSCRADLTRRRSVLEERISELGPGWTLDSARAVDVSMPTINAAADHAEAVAGAEATLEATEVSLAAAQRSHDDAEAQLTTAEAASLELRARIGTALDADAARDAALELHGLFPELIRAEVEAAADARLQALAREVGVGSEPTSIPPMLLPGLIAAALLSAVGAVTGVLVESPIAAGVLALVAVGLALLAFMVSTTTRTASRRPGNPATPTPAPEATSGSAQGDAPAPADPTASRPSPEHLRARVAQLATWAGLPPRPTSEQVADRLSDLNQLRAVDSALASVRTQLDEERRTLEQRQEQHGRARAELLRIRTHWQTWRTETGLPDDLEAAQAAPVLERLRIVREKATDVSQLHEELERLRAEDAQHRNQVGELLERAGMAADPDSGALAVLVERVDLDSRNRLRVAELREDARVAGERLRTATQRCEETDASLVGLLAGVGATDAEHYRRIVGIEERRKQLQDRLDEFEVELAARFGDTQATEAAREQLSTSDLARWEHEAAALSDALEDLDRDHESAVRDHQDALNALEQLETSADVPSASLAAEATRSELAEAIEQWTVATMAHRAVSHTLRRFETERQPEVVRAATESFRRITSGRYEALLPEVGSMEALMADGRRIDASRLSRGTTEQLYLSMRFGLALSQAAHNPLPLVLDDVLVNADPQRAVQLARELHTVAAKLQIIVFTCHHSTAELLDAQGHPTTVLAMATPPAVRPPP